MDRTIEVRLGGQPTAYRLHEDAYDLLARYLDRAAVRLRDDPDRAEVLADLERSVGDKLSALLGPADRLVDAADIDVVLDEIGAVETGREPDAPGDEEHPRRRRLHRIREGQQLAGVCNGLAAYAELRVDWVRTGFFFATLLTVGLFGLVYVGLAFVLPVVATREAWESDRG